MKKIAMLTSGGDAPGMNAAIRAVLRRGMSLGMEVYGIDRGYEGLLDGDIRQLEWKNGGDILQRGGTILRTARSSRFMEDKWIDHAADVLRTFGIEGLVVIGGDGSFRGGVELAKRGILVMGVPATIDNDLGYTDFTIGFDTAVNNVLDLIGKIRDTSSSHERATIIEVMGRHCGDIALFAGLTGGADVILVPEVKMELNDICVKVLRGQNSGKGHSIIVKAEGFELPLEKLRSAVEEMTGRETRTVIPGYIQRGGSPSSYDRMMASLMGAKAAELLFNDEDSRAVGIIGPEVVAPPLAEALKQKRPFRKDMYELSQIIS